MKEWKQIRTESPSKEGELVRRNHNGTIGRVLHQPLVSAAAESVVNR